MLVERSRGRSRDAAIDRVLNQGKEVVAVDRGTARVAARLLTDTKLDSCSAVNAIVVATAIRLGAALILTSDPDDLATLAMNHPGVEIEALR